MNAQQLINLLCEVADPAVEVYFAVLEVKRGEREPVPALGGINVGGIMFGYNGTVFLVPHMNDSGEENADG